MTSDFDVPVAIRREVGVSPTDELIGMLAETQHGVVARRQLDQLGLSESGIDRRLRAGRLRVLYRGVYAVGHRILTREGRYMAAVLACGDGAALSHRTAAEHRAIRSTSLIEVTTPLARRRRRGIRQYSATLAADEWELVNGIPTTTVARTLLDLAQVLSYRQLEAAVAEAEYRQLTSPTSLGALLERYPGRRGCRALRAVTARGAQRTHTDMEADFLAFLDEIALPRPLTQVARTIHGRFVEADCVFPDHGLIVELDGGSHKTERRFHSDRSRDRANQADGWRTVRVTQRHLYEEQEELAADLVRLLPAPDARRAASVEAARRHSASVASIR